MKETMVVEPTAQSDGMSTIHVDRVEVIVREANKEGAPLAESQMKVLRNELEVQNWLDPLMSLMRAAGNDTRIRILYLLWRRGEVRVNDLATILELTPRDLAATEKASGVWHRPNAPRRADDLLSPQCLVGICSVPGQLLQRRTRSLNTQPDV